LTVTGRVQRLLPWHWRAERPRLLPWHWRAERPRLLSRPEGRDGQTTLAFYSKSGSLQGSRTTGSGSTVYLAISALLAADCQRMPRPRKKAGHEARPVDQGG
jgi:hypothetical protein